MCQGVVLSINFDYNSSSNIISYDIVLKEAVTYMAWSCYNIYKNF